MHVNYEFKARCADIEALEQLIQPLHPRFIGTDHQVDTYFNTDRGRLKLREGTIEHSLIHYERSNVAGAKQSDVLLYEHAPNAVLKEILVRTLGVKVVVDKHRRIYFIDNVKFHFDTVDALGSFVEVEAIDLDGSISIDQLQEQCRQYAQLFRIRDEDYESHSYSDLLLAKKSSPATDAETITTVND